MTKSFKYILECKLITQQKRRKSYKKKDWDFTQKLVRFSYIFVYIQLNYASYTKRARVTFTCDASIYEMSERWLQSPTYPLVTKAAVGKPTRTEWHHQSQTYYKNPGFENISSLSSLLLLAEFDIKPSEKERNHKNVQKIILTIQYE